MNSTNDNVPINNVGQTLKKINKDIILKGCLFALLFYVVASPLFVQYLDRFLPVGFDTIIIQAIIFGILYYLIEFAI